MYARSPSCFQVLGAMDGENSYGYRALNEVNELGTNYLLLKISTSKNWIFYLVNRFEVV